MISHSPSPTPSIECNALQEKHKEFLSDVTKHHDTLPSNIKNNTTPKLTQNTSKTPNESGRRKKSTPRQIVINNPIDTIEDTTPTAPSSSFAQLPSSSNTSVTSFEQKQTKTKYNQFNKKKYNLKCSLCGNTFDTTYTLARHRKSHSNQNSFKCFICKKCFSSQANKQKHIKVQHANHPDIISCEICKIVFDKIEDLIIHRKHHSKNDFICDFDSCGKVFLKLYNLNRHKRMHCSKTTLTCSFCQKEFQSEKTLASHINKKHKKIPRYICRAYYPNCIKSFYYQSDLNVHISAVHDKNTFYSCGICNKPFFTKYKLKRHMTIHIPKQSKVSVASATH
ncbi:MAG: C2H2-type zinc finger protein [Endozoicomonadaceae bacterium]|nr:C2H2-type zinc finger protein [Endozoicomonadaceae bacterium]